MTHTLSKKTAWGRNLRSVVFGVLALAMTSPGLASDACTRSLIDLVTPPSQASKKIKRYPLSATSKDHLDDSHFQFGFESEYLLGETAGILRHYAPDPKLGVSLDSWQKLSDDERLEWVKNNIDILFPSFRTKGNLVKVSSELTDAFPDRVIRDETGNIEIIAGPFDTYAEWEEFITLNNKLFGEGSMQSTISLKWDDFFTNEIVSNAPMTARTDLAIAHLRAHNEIDQILKLYAASKKIADNGPIRAARNFEHPFLAPMSLDKETLLRRHMDQHISGKGFEKATLEEISHSDASYKYIGGIAYRPDIVGERRVVLEIRHAHKNEAILRTKLNELLKDFETGRNTFEQTQLWSSFDKRELFQKLSADSQTMLKELYPNKQKPGIDYTAAELAAIEVNENFSWPLRDWSEILKTFAASSTSEYNKLAKQVSLSQRRYQFRLDQIAMEYRQHVLTNDQAKEKVESELAIFVSESGIGEAASRWQKLYRSEDLSSPAAPAKAAL
ncbi:hypothetical protein GW916_15150 [bacterium]|nr:hypothetical protein [bacterium]